MELNDIHKAQISRFTSFFKGKRDRVLGDRESEKNNFISDRLVDESAIYNHSDVRLLIEAYHAEVMSCLRDELEKTANLSAVFVAQFCGQAEASGMCLQVEDISVIEDHNLIGQIGGLAAVNAPPLAPKQRTQLAAVSGTGSADPAILQELQDIKEENRIMKDRNMQLQTEISAALRERSMLSSQLDVAKMQATGGTDTALYERQLADARAQHDQKHYELENLKMELSNRLAESTQFRELKAIVRKKTSENKDLKQRMAAAGLAPPDDGEGIELTADDD